MKILNDHIKEWHKHSNRKPEEDAGAIHPSSLGDCDRLAIYKYLGLEPDLGHSDFRKRIFYHGYRIEDWMDEALRERGLLIASDIPVRATLQGVPIEGTIDHIVRWPPEEPDGWCIADTKSVSDHSFKYQSFPYEHHCLQVGAYQWALRQMLKSDTGVYRLKEELLPSAECPPVLFYVGRGNLEERTVSAGDNAMHEAFAKLVLLVDYIKRDAIPPRPFGTPDEHPYLCADCIKRGYKRSDDTYSPGREPVYVPSCQYFARCWDVMPEQWSFWRAEGCGKLEF